MKRRRNKGFWLCSLRAYAVAIIVGCCLLAACTETDTTVDSAELRHGDVRVSYKWTKDAPQPDSMTVMAVRVINYWKCGMQVSTKNLRGHYFFQAPEKIDPWVDPDKKEEETVSNDDNITVVIAPGEPYNGGIDPSVPDENELIRRLTAYDIVVDHFSLPKGTYKFYTLSVDTLGEVMQRRVTDYLQASSTGLSISEVYMEYASHRLKDPVMTVPLTGWHDENSGFGFVRGDVLPVYFDTQDLVEVDNQTDKTISFTPREVTQAIDLRLTIKKQLGDIPFVVDSVWAEVSGVPAGITAAGYIIKDPIRKTLFRMQLTDAAGKQKADTETATQVQARYRLHVPALIASNPTDTRGPGIMQVAVYISYEETVGSAKVKRARKLQVSGNISALINKQAPLKKSSEHYVRNAASVTLNVPTAISMSATEITKNAQWTQTYKAQLKVPVTE